VDQTSLVQAAEGGRQADADTQKLAHLHRCTNQSLQWLAARVLKHQDGTALVPRKGERPRRPARIQFASQGVLVLHLAKTAGSGVFPERGEHERRPQTAASRVAALGTVQNELSILAERLAGSVRKLQRAGLPSRFHTASPE
jgi:hypothetical protein